jgi:hypothetical protein
MDHRAAGIEFECEIFDHPALPEIPNQLVVIAFGCVRETVEQAVRSLEYCRRPDESV